MTIGELIAIGFALIATGVSLIAYSRTMSRDNGRTDHTE